MSVTFSNEMTGFVLGKKTSGDCWHTNATFRDITYWNHDDIPSHNDQFFRAFHWLTVSTAVSFFLILVGHQLLGKFIHVMNFKSL